MSDEIEQYDSDKLADIIWWIRGFQAATSDDFDEFPFDFGHLEALRKARLLMNKTIDEREKKNENIT